MTVLAQGATVGGPAASAGGVVAVVQARSVPSGAGGPARGKVGPGALAAARGGGPRAGGGAARVVRVIGVVGAVGAVAQRRELSGIRVAAEDRAAAGAVLRGGPAGRPACGVGAGWGTTGVAEGVLVGVVVVPWWKELPGVDLRVALAVSRVRVGCVAAVEAERPPGAEGGVGPELMRTRGARPSRVGLSGAGVRVVHAVFFARTGHAAVIGVGRPPGAGRGTGPGTARGWLPEERAQALDEVSAVACGREAAGTAFVLQIRNAHALRGRGR